MSLELRCGYAMGRFGTVLFSLASAATLVCVGGSEAFAQEAGPQISGHDVSGTVLRPGVEGGSNSVVPNNYEVIGGDTLWGICARFWGDPYFWPKLWSYNPGVGNAHFIYPGELLRFSQGSFVRPPGMSFGDDGGNGASPTDAWLAATSAQGNGGNGVSQVVDSGDSGTGSCAVPVDFTFPKSGEVLRTNLTGFLTKEKVRPIGKLVRSPESHVHLASRDTVYVQFSRLSEVSCGDVYTLYRPLDKKVRHPERWFRKMGATYQITGEVRILDVNDDFATGQITIAYSEVDRGDLLTEFYPVKRKVVAKSSGKELDAFIVGSLKSNDQSLSSRDIIYVDRGASDGVEEGDAFFIVRQGDGMVSGRSRGDDKLPEEVIGRIVIMATEENSSTGIITDATDVLVVGDRLSMDAF